jgi:histidine triad (HIT) family protein
MTFQPTCIFCQILSGEAKASVIYKDDLVTAFMDTRPLLPGHVLIIPNDHCSSLEDLDDTVGCHMFNLACRLAQAIRRSEPRSEGVNFFLADGEAAGQTVFHSHLHVIPRFSGDGFGIHFPPSYGQRPSRDELDERAEILQKTLDGLSA